MPIDNANETHNVEEDNVNEETNNNNEEPSNRPACAACKHQRKKCKKDCPLVRHFPANKTDQFAAVHKVFGIANISRMLKDLDILQQQEAVESFVWEAHWWKDDPVRGPYGLFKSLEQENEHLKEQLQRCQEILQLQNNPPNCNTDAGKLPQVENCLSYDQIERQKSQEISELQKKPTNFIGTGRLPQVENRLNYDHGPSNLFLNSPVNSYTSLLQGQDAEGQGKNNASSFYHQVGQGAQLGFQAGRPSFVQDLTVANNSSIPERHDQRSDYRVTQAARYNDFGQERVQHGKVRGGALPVNTRPGHAVAYYSNFCPISPIPYGYDTAQYPPPPMQNGVPVVPQGGFFSGLPQQSSRNSCQDHGPDQHNQVNPRANLDQTHKDNAG